MSIQSDARLRPAGRSSPSTVYSRPQAPPGATVAREAARYPGHVDDLNATLVTRLRAAGCVFAEDEAAVFLAEAATPAELEAMVGRRVAGEPVEHILGWAEFCGLRVMVAPGVFVPRHRTQLLVDEAARLAPAAPDGRSRPVVVDLCCGSGALGLAVVTMLGAGRTGGPRLVAVDIDPTAVACARRNIGPVGGRALVGDLYQPLPASLRGSVDIVVANVPYVPSAEIAMLPPEAREHEPLVALNGGADGLDVLRRVAAGAPAWLVAGGHLLVETSEEQAPLAGAAFADAGLVPRVLADETATVVIGTRPSSTLD